jgi:thiamine-monophosphate kinase
VTAGGDGGTHDDAAARMSVGRIGEFGLIDRILKQTGAGDASVLLGAGDDTAALRVSTGATLLATCDSMVEGRHFLRDRSSAAQIGRRLAAVNLSDIAAMGGQPRWALSSFVLPSATEIGFVEEVARGLSAELQRFGACVVGGNLTAGEQLVLDLTLLGEAADGTIAGRAGARVGDALLVTGDLGAAAAGRAALDASLSGDAAAEAIARQLTPQPRVAAGQTIATGGAHAMIDISDGLAQDLEHLCDASSVGAVLETALLPISAATRAVAAALQCDPLTWALGGGEDYELLCSVVAESAAALIDRVERATGVPFSRIGTVTDRANGLQLRGANGHTRRLDIPGWQHFGPNAGIVA